MALTKQDVNINFAQGMETKIDPYQLPIGKFQNLANAVFTKQGRLTKRNGYGAKTRLPDNDTDFVTTFKTDIVAIGNKLETFSTGYGTWIDTGTLQPLSLATVPLVRSNTSQSQSDSAVAANGIVCTVFTDQNPSSLSAKVYKYTVNSSETGQNIISPTVITGADATYGTPRVFLLGNYFVIVYTALVSAAYNLKFIAISTINPSIVTSPAVITTSYTPATTVAFDGVVLNNSLYMAWNGASASGLKMCAITSTLVVGSTFIRDALHVFDMVSVVCDESYGKVWVIYYNSSGTYGYVIAVDPALNYILIPTLLTTTVLLTNFTATASGGTLLVFRERAETYGYGTTAPSHVIESKTVAAAGSVGATVVVARSVGLASKAFIFDGTSYMLAVYQAGYQNTYFLIDSVGKVYAELAYGNAGGYIVTALPQVTVQDSTVLVSNLFRDLVASANTNTNIPAGNQVAGIYGQTGINISSFSFTSALMDPAEIGSNLNLNAGFLWAYDGVTPVEQNFFLYPDNVEVSATATTGGHLAALVYFYVATYEWSDNQGNVFRSAPSIPISKDLTGTGTSTNTNTVSVPTARLTYKVASPIKICIYRWSTSQPSYYQVTSITTPVLNSTTTDSISFVDTLADATILGNNLLYTNGGVVPNSGPPSFVDIFLFDERLFGITSEDRNLMWYSKQVIAGTPVEMSDLLTYYVNPNIGPQGSTGPLTCGFQMDDKCILFKESAINYFSGSGPDSTGQNSQYSEPIFITSTVGCSNSQSIILVPQGLMFEFKSAYGNQIWLLGRDLQTQYIGAPMEALTQSATVQSAENIPGTNSVRFTLTSGITISYDYFYGQWNTATNVPAISSTIYQGLHTYANNSGDIFQETPGYYLDGDTPVLMSFTTGWINLAGLQGYQRAYSFYLLGTYYSPHKLVIQIAYDYNPAPVQQSIINPTNFSPTYGTDLTYGSGTPYGGVGALEQWEIFFTRQRCQAFQITASEIYDPAYGQAAGQGLSISGINCVIGIKKGHAPLKSIAQVG